MSPGGLVDKASASGEIPVPVGPWQWSESLWGPEGPEAAALHVRNCRQSRPGGLDALRTVLTTVAEMKCRCLRRGTPGYTPTPFFESGPFKGVLGPTVAQNRPSTAKTNTTMVIFPRGSTVTKDRPLPVIFCWTPPPKLPRKESGHSTPRGFPI